MKTCKNCGETKPLRDFSKCSKNKDGYQYTCKICQSKESKEHYEKIKSGKIDKKPKFKGYDTYVNKDGVTCIKNFNPYGLSKQNVSKETSTILERRIPMTFSSDLAL